jgi:hypothetical protein
MGRMTSFERGRCKTCTLQETTQVNAVFSTAWIFHLATLVIQHHLITGESGHMIPWIKNPNTLTVSWPRKKPPGKKHIAREDSLSKGL